MAHSKRTIEIVKNLYIIENKEPAEISKIMEEREGIHVGKTVIYKWRSLYHWDKYIQQGGNIGLAMELQKQYFEELKKAIDEKKLTDPKTADSLVKIAKTLEYLIPKKTPTTNIFRIDADDVKIIIKNIIDHLIKKYE